MHRSHTVECAAWYNRATSCMSQCVEHVNHALVHVERRDRARLADLPRLENNINIIHHRFVPRCQT